MPIKHYGVLSARAVARRREGAADSPHYQIHLRDDAGTNYRAAVNVLSDQAPSELLYAVADDFEHPLTGRLPAAGAGWTELSSAPDGGGLDFIRGNLFDPASMRTLPPDLPGVDNDLADLLEHYVERAIADPAVGIWVFGQRWPTEAKVPDKVFGFLPGNGVHDIHMNQGNGGSHRQDNGVRQDGALLLHLPSERRWVAVFLAFQSQAFHTDDVTGNPIDTAPPRPQGGSKPLRIVAALVNPPGPEPEAETVTLLNTSAAAVELAGWQLADTRKQRFPLPGQRVAPGATVTVVTGGSRFRLGNHGGAITLLDPAGLKVHGVAYTERQAAREGESIAF
jgi:uncharacterized protein YukJ